MQYLWTQSHQEINRIYKMLDEFGYRLDQKGQIWYEHGEIQVEFQENLASTIPNNDIIVPKSWEFPTIHDRIIRTLDLSINYEMDVSKVVVIKNKNELEVIVSGGGFVITSYPCPECKEIVADLFVGHHPKCKLCQVNEIMSS